MSSIKTLAVLITGLPGSGKTYFAKRLAPAIGATYFSSDIMRKTVSSQRTYSFAEKSSVYHELLERFEHCLRATQSVVMDATFYKNEIRKTFSNAAVAAGGRVIWIEVRADEDEIRRRLSAPREDSEADFAVYERIRAEYEPLEETHLILYSDQQPLDVMIAEAKSWIGGNA